MEDAYRTVARESRTELKVKGSRFIGEALSAVDEAQARQKLQAVRKREHAATHHCYAWRVGACGPVRVKFSDDGEPSGTAGRPILEVITGTGLTNVLVVVTRYFGGTKLGTGGLVRAYTQAAQEALNAAGQRWCYRTREFRMVIGFDLYDAIQRVLAEHEATVVGSSFTDQVALVVSVRSGRADRLTAAIRETAAGKIAIEEVTAETDD